MNGTVWERIFRGNLSPLVCLSGGGILIMASDRLAHALITASALLWVYCLSSLAVFFGIRIFPRRGRLTVLCFLASFVAGIYSLLLWLLAPFSVLEVFFVVSLVPLFYMASGIFKRFEALSLADTLFLSASEALVLGALTVILALIREPLGFSSLSLPGGAQGIILLFSFNSESFLHIRLAASSSGALLLLGYFWGLYRYFKTIHAEKGK